MKYGHLTLWNIDCKLFFLWPLTRMHAHCRRSKYSSISHSNFLFNKYYTTLMNSQSSLGMHLSQSKWCTQSYSKRGGFNAVQPVPLFRGGWYHIFCGLGSLMLTYSPLFSFTCTICIKTEMYGLRGIGFYFEGMGVWVSIWTGTKPRPIPVLCLLSLLFVLGIVFSKSFILIYVILFPSILPSNFVPNTRY